MSLIYRNVHMQLKGQGMQLKVKDMQLKVSMQKNCKESRAEACMIGVRVCERKREREEVTLMNTKRNGG